MTDHQAHSTLELARIAGVDLEVLCVEHENDVRRAQGWTSSVLPLQIRILPRRWLRFIRSVLCDRHCVHVFAGPFGSYKMTVAFLLAALSGVRVYLLTEPYSPVAYGYFADRTVRAGAFLRSRMRPLLYWMYGRIFRKRIEGAFAISPLAAEQLRRMGVPRERIFPFGYFVPAATESALADTRPQPRTCNFAYVGTLSYRKGLDLLVTAAGLLQARGVAVQIHVYGHGNAERFGLDTSTVKYRGPIAFGETQRVMREYDALVLPSRYDGWGVVVNEAILAGVPVVCSADAGAAAMVRKWHCGVVYEHSNASALADALAFVSNNGPELERMRTACSNLRPWLSPTAAGQYMYDVINRDRASAAWPENPWY